MAKTVQEWIVKVIAVGGEKVLKLAKSINAETASGAKATAQAGVSHMAAGSAAKEHYKQSKGVANATANQTKAFSKMEQGMVGGLVPAYATVAANIFALTAAFGALSRAADYQVLIQGAQSLEAQTGRSLANLAASMQEVTDSSITMKEALTSASIAASAGFDNSTILQLTNVARNASIALGRDMTDAMNRVFKGAVKAEPELLDELGIILRLDPATRKYAASVGKAVSELTTFEKQQAVVNEVIAQGEEKFSELSEVDVSPFAQLSSAFLEATNAILGFINIGLGPIINVLTDNLYILIGAMAIFGNTILKSAIPALQKLQGEVAEGLAKSFDELGNTLESQDIAIGYFDSMKDDLSSLDSVLRETRTNLSTSFELIEQDLPKDLMKNVWGDINASGNIADNVSSAIDKVNVALNDLDPKADDFRDSEAALIDVRGALEAYEFGVLKVTGQTDKLKGATDRSTTAFQRFRNNIKLTKLSAFEGFLSGTSGGFEHLTKNIKRFERELDRAQVKGALFGKTMKGISLSLFKFSGVLGSLVKAIPIIGQISFAFGILKSVVGGVLKLFTDSESIEKATEALENYDKAVKTATKSSIYYDKKLKTLPKTSANLTKQLTVQTNILNELNTALEETIENFDGFVFGVGEDIDEFTDALERQLTVLEKLGQEDRVNEIRKEFLSDLFISKKEALAAANATQELTKAMQDLANATKDANEKLKEAFDQLDKGLKKVQGDLPTLSGAEQSFASISNILNRAEFADPAVFRSLLADTSSFQAALTGTVEELKLLTRQQKSIGNISDKVVELRQEMELIPKTIREMSDSEFGQKFKPDITLPYRKLQAEQQQYIDLQERTGKIADQTVKKILSAYQKLQIQLQISIGLQKKLAEETQKLNFQLSLPGNTIADKAEIYSNIAKANIDAARQQIADANATTLAIQDGLLFNAERLEKVKKDIEKLTKDTEGETVTEEIERETLLLTRQEELLSSRAALTYQQLQVSKMVGDQQLAINAALIQEFNEIRKLINDLNEADFNDIQSGRGGATALNTLESLRPIAEQLGIAFEIPKENIKEWSNEMLKTIDTASKLDAVLKGFGITADAVSKRMRNNDALIESYENEINYMRETNTLLDDAIDKESRIQQFKNNATQEILQELLFQALLNDDLTQELRIREMQAKLTKENNQLKQVGALLVAKEANTELVRLSTQTKQAEMRLRYGTKLTKMEKNALAVDQKRAELEAKKFSPKQIDEYIKKLKELQKIKFEISFGDDIQAALDELSELPNIFDQMRENIENLENPIDKMSAGFLAGMEIAKEYGNEQLEGVNGMGLALSNFGKELEKFKMGEFVDIVGAGADAAIGFGNAMMQAAEDGSAASKAGAVISGLGAMVKAWESAPWPYNIPAVVTTAASVASLLSQMGESADLGSAGGGGGSAKAEDYKASFGNDRVTGQELQTNSLVDSLDGLTTINDSLFGAEKELKRAIYALKKSFDSVGAALFKTGGTFSAGDITTNFGIGFGEETTPAFLGLFGGSTTTTELLAGGLQLGATIEYVAGEFMSSIDNARIFITSQVTKTKSGFLGIGGGTDTDIETSFRGLDAALQGKLDGALTATLDTIVSLVDNWGGDVETYFDDFRLDLPQQQINLVGLSAEEQATVVGAYFSGVGNQVVGEILPWLENWSYAGEELIDTLIRLTNSTLVLNDAFSAGGTSVDELANLSAGSSQEAYNRYVAGRGNVVAFWEEQEKDALHIVDVVTSYGGERNRVPEIARLIVKWDDDISTFAEAMTHLDNITDGHIGGGVSSGEYNSILNYYRNDARQAGQNADNVTVKSFEKWHRDRVDNARAAWITSLEKYYGGTFEEFGADYQRFLEAVFSPEDLAEIQKTNAEAAINQGLFEIDALRFNEFGKEAGWSKVLREADISIDTTEGLAAAYTLLAEKGLFAGDAGAQLLELFVALGIGFGDLADATEEVEQVVDNFLRDILRQIKAFGLEGKELDLLNLQYEFEDLMAEAVIKGAEEVAAVELLYGLERLQIVTDYNEQMVDSFKDAFEKINDSIITIISTSEDWNESAYQSLKIQNIKDRLQKSFLKGDFADSGLQPFIDAFFELAKIDTSGTEDFTEALGEFIYFSEEVPENLQEQIDLALELEQSIMDRYQAELGYMEELKQLSLDIQGYLDDLAVSELSPLTNMQQFQELSARFAEDMDDLLSGDKERAAAAGARILDDADALLQAGFDLYAIGPEYQSLFEYVASSLETVDDVLQDQIITEQGILNSLQETTLEELGAVKGILTILEQRQSEIYLGEIKEILFDLAVPMTEILTVLQTNLPSMLTALTAAAPWPVQPQDQSSLIINAEPMAVGNYNVPFDQLALVHKGEMVVPEVTAEGIREGYSSIGGTIDTTSIVNAIGVMTQVLAESQEEIINQGERQINTTRDIATNQKANTGVGTVGII